jgi:hypothetical protein
LNSEAISYSDATAEQRLSERRRTSREQLHITWDRDVKLLQVITKCLYVANAAETEERILIHEKAAAGCELISTPLSVCGVQVYNSGGVRDDSSLLFTSLDEHHYGNGQQDKPTD